MEITAKDIEKFRDDVKESISLESEIENYGANDFVEMTLHIINLLCDDVTILCDYVEDYHKGIH